MVAVRTCVHKPCASQIYNTCLWLSFSSRVCVCVCIYIYIYICIYVHPCICIYIYTYTYTRVYIHITKQKTKPSHDEGLEYSVFRQNRFSGVVFSLSSMTLPPPSHPYHFANICVILPLSLSLLRCRALARSCRQIKSEEDFLLLWKIDGENLWKNCPAYHSPRKIYRCTDEYIPTWERSHLSSSMECISKFDPSLELSMQYPKLVTLRQWSLYTWLRVAESSWCFFEHLAWK